MQGDNRPVAIFLARRATIFRFETASTDLVEVEKKKRGEENAIDRLMDEVSELWRLLLLLLPRPVRRTVTHNTSP